MKTLYARIAFSFLLIVALLGGSVLLFSYFSMQSYHEELTQKINQPIAMYVGQEYEKLRDRMSSDEALQQLGNHAMIINPTVEVYLLDRHGRILSNTLPKGTLQRETVDIDRVQRFVDGNINYPLRAEDPRQLNTQKVFSAFPVMLHDGNPGFVYVILGGKTLDTIVENIRSSYVAKTALWGLLGILLIGILLGLLVFSLLVRRLERLSAAMSAFSASGNSRPRASEPELHYQKNGDEIDRLSANFVSMAGTISSQMQKLQETDQLRRELVSNISHDLRTPLATTRGYIDTLLIKDGSLDRQERSSYLANAQKSIGRLGQLIDDLFELSKLESGQIKPDPEYFSVLELMYDTVQEFALEAGQKNITINAPVPARDTMVYADVALIQRVLENLLKNALKYTPRNGVISLGFAVENNKVIISIEDTGYGIAEQDLKHIFDRFYRVNHTGDTNIQSTGLGLAIVKRILELHDSRFTVKSQVNKGSCFRFDLNTVGLAH